MHVEMSGLYNGGVVLSQVGESVRHRYQCGIGEHWKRSGYILRSYFGGLPSHNQSFLEAVSYSCISCSESTGGSSD